MSVDTSLCIELNRPASIFAKTLADLPKDDEFPIRFGTIARIESTQQFYVWHNTWILVKKLENRIVSAAAKFPDGTIIVSVRHYDELFRNMRRRLHLLDIPESDIVQGFVDKFGEFHDRKSAWRVANTANQIVKRVGGDETTLYSENLY